jgi:hypothetical protein
MPASAVSTVKATCFSIWSGDSAGARMLIWTWLLVMSGTASIGSRWMANTPANAAASVSSRTSQRFSTARVTMRESMV